MKDNGKAKSVVKCTRPEIFRRLSPVLLAELLGRYPALLEARGLQLPADPVEESMPFRKITELFLCTDGLAEQDASLYEAIYLVDHLASSAGRCAIFQAAEQRSVVIPPEAAITNHDLALWVWLHHPRLLESASFRVEVHGNQSYFYYRPANELVVPLRYSPDTVQRFRHSLRAYYKGISRGSSVQVLDIQDGDELWILIRHGGIMERHASISDETDFMESICFRDEEYDIIIYNRIHGDLKIRYSNKKTIEVLRSVFGRLFFGGADYFTARGMFFLDRFREPECSFVASTIVSGIGAVVLEEVCYLLPGGCDLTIHEKSSNLLHCLRECSSVVPAKAILVDSAHLGFKFEGSQQYRSVKLTVPNKANYARESDAWLVEQWLRKAGLMKTLGQVENMAVA